MDFVRLDVAQIKGPTLVHIVQDLPKHFETHRKEGVRILTSKIVRNSTLSQDPNIKTSSYLNSLLALQDAKARGGDDAIMCDMKGNVTEGTNFSVFAVKKDGRLVTPSLEVGILDSITRRHVIESARKQIEVEEGFYPLADFLDSEETFIVSSTREIVPIREWDDRVFPVDGPVTKSLHQKLENEIQRYVSTHPKF